MEARSKLNHDLQRHHLLPTLSSNLQTNQTSSYQINFLKLSTILLLILIEAYFKPLAHFLPLTCSLLFIFTFNHFLLNPPPPPIYLVDFSCLKPPSFCRVPFSAFTEHITTIKCFNQDSISFMNKILLSSGQGEETYLPPSLHYIPPRTHQQESIKETHMVLFPVIDELLSKTKISPRDIDILIVNCSAFCPSPSLSSIIINKYSMRDDIKSFNLSGMGCSASAIGIDLARNLLKIHKNSYVVVLSTEIISTGWYPGNDRTMLLPNCLFRMGSAAVLLTNREESNKRSKYKLVHTVRTQRIVEDKAYLSAIREEDSKGITGVTLNKDLLQVAGETLRSNITVLGGSILPWSEKIRHSLSLLKKRFINPSVEIYVPDFKSVIHHFCIPTSGKAVIREISKGLKLSEKEMEAAIMTLHRFGNQSSSSMWYELAYMEAKEMVKRGEKVWQLGMGTGPKCSSVVWECLRPIVGEAKKGPWSDCVDRYPLVAAGEKGTGNWKNAC